MASLHALALPNAYLRQIASCVYYEYHQWDVFLLQGAGRMELGDSSTTRVGSFDQSASPVSDLSGPLHLNAESRERAFCYIVREVTKLGLS